MGYYKSKLKNKIETFLLSKGLCIKDIDYPNSLFINLEPGNYKIIWESKYKKIKDLKKLEGNYEVESGYYIYKGDKVISSEHITFDISEHRDFSIKKLLKKMKTILVTGGAGYIGTHTIAELLKDDNYNVIILDNFCNSNPLILNRLKKVTNKSVKIYDRDCRANLDDIFKDNKIDGVIHFAALKSVGESVDNPLLYYDNNINSLINLLYTCEKFDVNKFIFSSSCSLYGDVDKLPVSESTPIKYPKSPYANTKLVGENVIKDFCQKNKDFSAISLRYFNPVGAHDSGLIGESPINKPNNILPVICNSVENDEIVNIFGGDYKTRDGTCIRDYIHVSDISTAHCLAMDYIFDNKISYDVFNLGSDEGYSVLELIVAFQEENDLKVNYKIVDRRPGDVVEIYSNSRKANKKLNWSPIKTIDDIVSSAWKWHQNKL